MRRAKIVELPLDRHRKLRNFMLANLSYLDEGCFASVYESVSDKHKYVVKTGGIDDPYLAYAKAIVRKRKYNPFLPKINKIIIVNDTYYVVMEKLKPLLDDWKYCMDYDDLADLNKAHNKNRGANELKSAIKLIEKIIKENRMASLDIHSSNIMLRGRNQLVITDPIC